MKFVSALGLTIISIGGFYWPGGLAVAQTAPSPASRLAIAGVGVRMSVPEAVAALRAGGWAVSRQPGESWRAAVDGEIQRQRAGSADWKPSAGEGDVVASKNDERIGIRVRPSPRGGEVETVSYSAPFAGRSPMEMGRQLYDRYGGTGRGSASANGFYIRWCDPIGCGPSSAKLTAETGGSEHRLRLALFWSEAQHTAYDRMVGDAIRARTGGGKASF